jgi:hypothetical protein
MPQPIVGVGSLQNDRRRHGSQASVFLEEQIPYFLAEVQSLGEKRPLENESDVVSALKVRTKQQDKGGTAGITAVKRQRESVRERRWRSESDCNPTFSAFA